MNAVHDGVVLTVDVGVAGVLGVQSELLQHTAGNQQTSGVGSGVVGVSDGEAIAGQLVAIGSSQDEVSLDLGIDDLADGVLVCETDHQSVLVGSKLSLILDDQGITSAVVSLALSPATVLNLVSGEV